MSEFINKVKTADGQEFDIQDTRVEGISENIKDLSEAVVKLDEAVAGLTPEAPLTLDFTDRGEDTTVRQLLDAIDWGGTPKYCELNIISYGDPLSVKGWLSKGSYGPGVTILSFWNTWLENGSLYKFNISPNVADKLDTTLCNLFDDNRSEVLMQSMPNPFRAYSSFGIITGRIMPEHIQPNGNLGSVMTIYHNDSTGENEAGWSPAGGMKLYLHDIADVNHQSHLYLICAKSTALELAYEDYDYRIDGISVDEFLCKKCVQSHFAYYNVSAGAIVAKSLIFDVSGGGGSALDFSIYSEKSISSKAFATTSEWPTLTDTVTEL